MAEFLDRVHNDVVFESILHRVQRLPELDPSLAFQQALPGFLGDVVQMEGPWPGRDTKRWAIDGKSDIGLAIGPDQRARIGGVSEKHIVALRGLEVAGVTQKVGLQDFQYGGMTQEAAERKALLPLRSFNERVSKSAMDVVTAGDFSGSVTNDFRWSATSQDGETVQADIITDTANEVPDVYANDSQTFLWPLRDGSEAAAGHDHISDFPDWVIADARTARDNILEHPGAGSVVAYASTKVAAAVRAAAKTEFGAIVERVPLIREGQTRQGGFGSASPMGIVYENIEWYYAPDMPAGAALYVAGNQKPFHAHVGNVGSNGQQMGRGAWTEIGDQERLGRYYGMRDYVSLGVKNPVGAVYADHNT